MFWHNFKNLTLLTRAFHTSVLQTLKYIRVDFRLDILILGLSLLKLLELRYSRKNLAMEKPLKMIEGMISTDSFWS